MKKFLKVFMAAWVLFIVASVALGGGDKLRSISEDTGSVIEKVINMAADKADSFKEDAVALKETIEKWTGSKKESAEKKV